MWQNLSYASKSALGVAQRLARYAGSAELEAIHLAIATLEVSANAFQAATTVASREGLATALNGFLAQHRQPSEDDAQIEMGESARTALDVAHRLTRSQSVVHLFTKPASWKAISTDEILVGCLNADERTGQLLSAAGVSEAGLLEAMRALPAESRRTELTLTGLLKLDPEDYLLRR